MNYKFKTLDEYLRPGQPEPRRQQKRLGGRAETYWKYTKEVDYYHGVQRRWNLVTRCSECGQFMHDLAGEQLYIQAKFGLVSGKHRSNVEWSFRRKNWCTDCLHIPFCAISPCDLCGVFGGLRKVHRRDGTNEGQGAYSPDPGEIFPRSHPRTCAPCGKRLVRALADLAEAKEISRLINRLKKEAHGHKDRQTA